MVVLNREEREKNMILFVGDYVRMTNEDQWLQIKEIHFHDHLPENNTMTLSDGYVCPAPVDKYIEEYRSEDEQMEAYAAEVREQEERAAPTADKWEETYYSDAVHHAEASQY